MTDAKLEIKVGPVSFTGEGPGEWLSKQLDKVLAKLPELAAIRETETEIGDADGSGGQRALAPKSKRKRLILAAFLKDKKAATGNQQRKFLATAAWLEDSGAKRVLTGDVTL